MSGWWIAAAFAGGVAVGCGVLYVVFVVTFMRGFR